MEHIPRASVFGLESTYKELKPSPIRVRSPRGSRCLESTYKELKQVCGDLTDEQVIGLESTYKELKRSFKTGTIGEIGRLESTYKELKQ